MASRVLARGQHGGPAAASAQPGRLVTFDPPAASTAAAAAISAARAFKVGGVAPAGTVVWGRAASIDAVSRLPCRDCSGHTCTVGAGWLGNDGTGAYEVSCQAESCRARFQVRTGSAITLAGEHPFEPLEDLQLLVGHLLARGHGGLLWRRHGVKSDWWARFLAYMLPVVESVRTDSFARCRDVCRKRKGTWGAGEAATQSDGGWHKKVPWLLDGLYGNPSSGSWLRLMTSAVSEGA